MSAKWRRSRTNSRKFDISKVFNKVRNNNLIQRFRFGSPGSRRRVNSYTYRVQRISPEKKIREPKHLVDVLEGNDEISVVRIEVNPRDKSKLIGKGGRNINMIRKMVQRHYHIKDVQIV